MEASAPKRRSRIGLLVGLAALATLIVGVLHFGEAERFVELAREARPGWLLLGFALQAATYATEAGSWQIVLRRAGRPAPFFELYTQAIVGLFTNQAVPTAGVAGTLVVVRAMERHGVPNPVAVAAVLVDLVGYYLAFGLAVAFTLVVLWAHHDLSPIVLAMAGAIVLVGTGISVGALRIVGQGGNVPAWVGRIGALRKAVESLKSADPALVRSPGLLARAGLIRAGNFAADGLTLWACLRAVGQTTPPWDAISACTVGTLARTLGVVPGGLGTFEGGAVGGLALFGVAVEPGLAATLLFRGLSFWLPMPVGLWLGNRLARRERA